jgi:HPt (histidine-containing phosphotransfer) domain-containing protein
VPAAAGGVLDAATLEELTGGDPGLAATLLDDFLESSRQDAAELASALARQDRLNTQRQAHRLKGAARIVGAHEIATIADRIESSAGAPPCDWAVIADLADELQRQLERVSVARA